VAIDDDALDALWSIFDATGIRPEYLLPVLYFESGFNPQLANAAGAPYYGIAQTSGAHLAALGTTPADYLALSAGAQIRLAVAPYFATVVKHYGPVESATRAEQANFLPATLQSVPNLSQVLAARGSRTFVDNARSFGAEQSGAIRVADLAGAMAKSAAAPAVTRATARAYELRPSAGRPKNPVYGSDFLSPALSLAALTLLIVWAVRS
jgi:hypothetical protein